MTNEEIKQLWLESGKTLLVECLSKEGAWGLCLLPSFFDDIEYRFASDQDFSIINDKVKKAWEDSGKTLAIEVTSVNGGWIERSDDDFYPSMIYRIKPEQQITWDDSIGYSENKDKYTSADAITDACEQIKNMLLEKNRKYGNSALNPVRVFSKANTAEQLRVRMDDKLSRIQSAQDDDIEDAMLDLTGYLVLDLARKLMEEKGD